MCYNYIIHGESVLRTRWVEVNHLSKSKLNIRRNHYEQQHPDYCKHEYGGYAVYNVWGQPWCIDLHDADAWVWSDGYLGYPDVRLDGHIRFQDLYGLEWLLWQRHEEVQENSSGFPRREVQPGRDSWESVPRSCSAVHLIR